MGSLLQGEIMPQAPRINDKATRIQYRIIGKPSNMKSRPSRKQKRIRETLDYQDSSRIK